MAAMVINRRGAYKSTLRTRMHWRGISPSLHQLVHRKVFVSKSSISSIESTATISLTIELAELAFNHSASRVPRTASRVAGSLVSLEEEQDLSSELVSVKRLDREDVVGNPRRLRVSLRPEAPTRVTFTRETHRDSRHVPLLVGARSSRSYHARCEPIRGRQDGLPLSTVLMGYRLKASGLYPPLAEPRHRPRRQIAAVLDRARSIVQGTSIRREERYVQPELCSHQL